MLQLGKENSFLTVYDTSFIGPIGIDSHPSSMEYAVWGNSPLPTKVHIRLKLARIWRLKIKINIKAKSYVMWNSGSGR